MAVSHIDASDACIPCDCDSTRCGCTGRAWCSVLRDGKRLRLCDRCDLSTDEAREPLTTAHLTASELEAFAQYLERSGTELVQRSMLVAQLAATKET